MNNKKILVCDDDLGILEMIELILQEEGYVVITVEKSVNALRTIQSEKPDLVLLDIWMPVISGDQVLRSMKADRLIIPVLMYSASSDGEAIAKTAGADDYIAKPFDINKLLNKIRSLLA